MATPVAPVWESRVSITDRRARIMADLERLGSVSVTDLVDQHHVSEMTIRRDLALLEEEGLLRRFHGGAVLDRPRSFEPPYLLRESQRRLDKQRMAAVAVELISDGDIVSLDYGTTVLAVAERLAERQNITAVTPNVRAALQLVECPTARVLVAGGQLRSSELALAGRDAEATFERYHVDHAIMSAAGVDPAAGITDFNPDEVAVKRAMIAGARHVIVVADASKVGVVAFASVVALAAVDVFVTTDDADEGALKAIADHGVEVHAV